MMDVEIFRAALVKIMPGYNWTIHRVPTGATTIVATGIQSSGFNRLSTLQVTLARALRGLQDHYRQMAALYSGHERALENARRAQEVAA